MSNYEKLVEWINNSWEVEDKEKTLVYLDKIKKGEGVTDEEHNIVSDLVSKYNDKYLDEVASELNDLTNSIKLNSVELGYLKEKLSNKESYKKTSVKTIKEINLDDMISRVVLFISQKEYELKELKIQKEQEKVLTEQQKQEKAEIDSKMEKLRYEIAVVRLTSEELNEKLNIYNDLRLQLKKLEKLSVNSDLEEKINELEELINEEKSKLDRLQILRKNIDETNEYDENQMRLDQNRLYELSSGIDAANNRIAEIGNVDYNILFEEVSKGRIVSTSQKKSTLGEIDASLWSFYAHEQNGMEENDDEYVVSAEEKQNNVENTSQAQESEVPDQNQEKESQEDLEEENIDLSDNLDGSEIPLTYVFGEILSSANHIRRMNFDNDSVGYRDTKDEKFLSAGTLDKGASEKYELNGQYINEKDIEEALKNYYKKEKGRKLKIKGIKKEVKITRGLIRKLKRKLKVCSSVKLIKEKKLSSTDIKAVYAMNYEGRFTNYDRVGNVVANIPDGKYVSLNDVYYALEEQLNKKTLKDKLKEWFSFGESKLEEHNEQVIESETELNEENNEAVIESDEEFILPDKKTKKFLEDDEITDSLLYIFDKMDNHIEEVLNLRNSADFFENADKCCEYIDEFISGNVEDQYLAVVLEQVRKLFAKQNIELGKTGQEIYSQYLAVRDKSLSLKELNKTR